MSRRLSLELEDDAAAELDRLAEADQADPELYAASLLTHLFRGRRLDSAVRQDSGRRRPLGSVGFAGRFRVGQSGAPSAAIRLRVAGFPNTGAFGTVSPCLWFGLRPPLGRPLNLDLAHLLRSYAHFPES